MADKNRQRYNNPVSATLSGIADLFKKQVPAGELKPADRLDGKIVLIDGASSGLGFAVAVDAACRGARVIMACRSGIPEKGEEVKKLSGNPDVQMVSVDFSDIASIQNLVLQIKELLGEARIDIFICNSAVVPRKSRKTPQGLEEMFMVNYFSKFLFINLLLEKDCFWKSAVGSWQLAVRNQQSRIQYPVSSFQFPGPGIGYRLPRIIFISSESHRNPTAFDWASFGIYKDYSIGKSIELYGYYKLLLTTFAAELSRRLNQDGSQVSVFALCPGPINSNIGREAPKIFTPLLKLVFSLFFRSPAKAAIPVIYLAASQDQEGKQFDYLFLMCRKEVDEKASDAANGERLWQMSEQLAGKLFDNKF